MFKLNPKKILLKTPTIYQYQPPIPLEVRKAIIQKKMTVYPNLVVKGGNSLTNPYKIPYELVLADRRELFEKYNNSVLWSPRFTPWHFTNLFLFPAFLVAVLMWYITYVAIPKRAMYLRNRYGYVFKDLEQRGWFDGWLDEDQEETREEIMGFNFRTLDFENKTENKVHQKKYTDFTLRDIQNFESKTIYTTDETLKRVKNQQEIKPQPTVAQKNYKYKMQQRFEKVYNQQQENSE